MHYHQNKWKLFTDLQKLCMFENRELRTKADHGIRTTSSNSFYDWIVKGYFVPIFTTLWFIYTFEVLENNFSFHIERWFWQRYILVANIPWIIRSVIWTCVHMYMYSRLYWLMFCWVHILFIHSIVIRYKFAVNIRFYVTRYNSNKRFIKTVNYCLLFMEIWYLLVCNNSVILNWSVQTRRLLKLLITIYENIILGSM